MVNLFTLHSVSSVFLMYDYYFEFFLNQLNKIILYAQLIATRISIHPVVVHKAVLLTESVS